MKQIPTEFYTFTEIGGVGEMVYKAVRFPEYVPQHDYEEKADVIVPVFTSLHRPISGTDYSVTGQELLASLCNLYKNVNGPDSTTPPTELIWNWCRNNIHPYSIDTLCNKIETGSFMDANFLEHLRNLATFEVRDFISDLCRLGTVFEYYSALQEVRLRHDVAVGRSLYYEGRICDSLPFLEKYRQYTDDAEYLKHFNEDYDDRIFDALEMFPDFKMRVKQDKKSHKTEMSAEIHTVFDIAWYAFARMVSDVAPPADTDMNYMYSQGSILTCMACGQYFVRHSSRQRYCDNPNCKAERNNRKARAYYQRKKISD